MDPDPAFGKSYEIFQLESKKLQDSIQHAQSKSEKAISDIIEIYYQVIKVGTLAKLLKESYQVTIEPKHQMLLDRIDEVQNQIDKKFNLSLHPVILSHLTDSVQRYTDNLKLLAKESGQKSKESIETEAKLYKELRELMSTKEFVEQYENGLKDD